MGVGGGRTSTNMKNLLRAPGAQRQALWVRCNERSFRRSQHPTEQRWSVLKGSLLWVLVLTTLAHTPYQLAGRPLSASTLDPRPLATPLSILKFHGAP